MNAESDEKFNVLYKKHDTNGDHWIKIGRAYPTRAGDGIRIYIDALPLNSEVWDGSLVVVDSERRSGNDNND